MNTYNIDKMYESYSNEVERTQKMYRWITTRKQTIKNDN